MLTIKEWAEEDRPREKLMLKGVGSLSDAELLTILISTGTRKYTALQLAQHVLQLTDNNLGQLGKLGVRDFTKVHGIGEAKAITIVAALELGRRRNVSEVVERESIRGSMDIATLFQAKLADLPHEEFWLLMLNSSLKVMNMLRVSQGGVDFTPVDVRLVMKPAVECLCSAIAVVHNHPSGNVRPSEQDMMVTRKISEASKLFGIRMIDHVIVGDSKTYFSFADEGMV